jgi:phosphatidylserine/phosphatidylglycerophosphate/cardiolipin synthase-like enzyme
MKNKILNLFILVFIVQLYANNVYGQKIKTYFNKPVNNNVSTGVNAIYLNQTMDDTLVAYINRAKFTLDIAVYNYSASSFIADIAGAVNAAYARGVVVRWIYDGGSSNTGLATLNTSIPKLASPTGSNYTIMHNKFMIVDANSTNLNDPIVWTGASNWGSNQFNSDYNNTIVIQDKNLALAYTTEFNEMWGSATTTPNLSLSKFGPFKSDNTPHFFTIEGKTVELYFSPSDGTTNKIIQAVNSANHSMYFGVYTFTENDISNAIIPKIQQGVYTLGIIDDFSVGYTPITDLSPIMNSNLIIYNQNNSYHSKLLIVDPCNPNSDPLVLTGSHNWSGAANTDNDENTLIIHDDTIANVYYQSFHKDFTDAGGTLTPCSILASNEELNFSNSIKIFPNPSQGKFTIQSNNNEPLHLSIISTEGKTIIDQETSLTGFEINLTTGMYLIKLTKETGSYICKKLLINNN